MREQGEWRFSDDRGQLSVAGRRPARVLAYVQAGATLWDHGIRPSGIFGSDHDDSSVADPAKTGSLPATGIDYAGAGSALDVDTLLRGGTDLVVAVSYGGGHVYGLAPETAKHLEEQVPVVVIDVGHSRTLADVGDRFAELAHSLGAEQPATATRELDAARERLRVLASAPAAPRVVALSPAGPDQAYVARPGMWPELRVLAGLGVDLVEPSTGPGANWSTMSWADTAALRPAVVLTDIRSNAAPVEEIRTNQDWIAIEGSAQLVPWNPEPVCSAHAHAGFLDLVVDAFQAAGTRA